jgi:hypothetical protein
MRIIIEIEKDEDIEKLKRALKGETNNILESIFNKYNVKLPQSYSFDREAVHTSVKTKAV